MYRLEEIVFVNQNVAPKLDHVYLIFFESYFPSKYKLFCFALTEERVLRFFIYQVKLSTIIYSQTLQ